MEQKYREIDIKKDVRMKGDETTILGGLGVWTPITQSKMGFPYINHHSTNMKYRRPITEQYVYENAGFSDPTTTEMLNLMNAISKGSEFFDSVGGCVVLCSEDDDSVILEANGDPIRMQDLYIRKPAPRTMKIGEAVCAELEEAHNESDRLRNGLIDLYSVACCCDSWDSFPSESLDKAARILDGVKPPEAE